MSTNPTNSINPANPTKIRFYIEWLKRVLRKFFNNIFATPPKIRFYVDWLNFYHGVAKGYGIKWIDIEKLLIELIKEKIPNAELDKVIIFTAVVKKDPKSYDLRQQNYLRALRKHSSNNIEIVKGSFNNNATKRGQVIKIRGQEGNSVKMGDSVEIRTREEKQTDVNIACRIMKDTYEDKTPYIPCLVSNDSDLAYPLIFKNLRGERIFLITPITEKLLKRKLRKPSRKLKKDMLYQETDMILEIKKELVKKCQLPDKVGKFSIPEEWKEERNPPPIL